MKQKVAKLLYATLCVRVIVDADASEESIIEAAKYKMWRVVREDLGDNIEDIVDDIECPHNPENDDIPDDFIDSIKRKIIQEYWDKLTRNEEKERWLKALETGVYVAPNGRKMPKLSNTRQTKR